MNWFRKGKYLDEEIIQIIQEGDLLKNERMNKYLLEVFFKPILYSQKAINILQETKLRIDAYQLAFAQFTAEIRSDNFRKTSTLKTFFNTIFLNRCKDALKHLSSNTSKMNRPTVDILEDKIGQLSESSKSILDNLIEKMDVEFIFQQFKKISETCFQVISLKFRGYSYKEIGLDLNKSAENVKSTHYNCIQKIKQQIN